MEQLWYVTLILVHFYTHVIFSLAENERESPLTGRKWNKRRKPQIHLKKSLSVASVNSTLGT